MHEAPAQVDRKDNDLDAGDEGDAQAKPQEAPHTGNSCDERLQQLLNYILLGPSSFVVA